MVGEEDSYRQIVKATSLFGGVQAFNIVISIVRSKIIAVLLGPAGMGIAGLFTSTTGLVGGITNFGLGTSAVRDVAAANESSDTGRISRVVTVFRRLVWLTGALGAVVTLVLAPWLSQLTFGSKEYTLAFRWLSVTLLFGQLASGQGVLLQGMRRLKLLARANMAGSVAGLLISVPIYYFWRIDGIVPAIIVSSVASLIIAWHFASKIKIENSIISRKDILDEGKGMLKMGFMLSLSGLITTAASYIIRIYISNTGGVEDVGLYSAGFAIISTYVGLVFTAMSTDYYPRLSGVAHDNRQAALLINQQAEVAVLVLAPILTVFLIFINFVVILLYSTKFTPVNGMILWAAIGMYFKAACWAVGFILLAKGASTLFFWNEIICNIYMLIFNILGYKFMGLNGLGISFAAGYLVYLVQVYLFARKKFQFSFNIVFIKIFSIQLFMGILCFMITKFIPVPWAYIAGLPVIAVSAWYSFRELDRRMQLRTLLQRKSDISGSGKE
ncbi:MAG: O-antigen translocase [Bacteroidales bacterium]|nr:O-antigen translocase [Bacteroidales bacterium]